jgi:nitroreductase
VLRLSDDQTNARLTCASVMRAVRSGRVRRDNPESTMSFLDLARRRYSVRSYRPDPVPDELLVTILEAARVAPTAANRQPVRVIVVHTAGREAELRRIYDRGWFVGAPLILCVCAVPGEAWTRSMYDGRSHADVDAAIVMDHMVLAAADLGLGTCWVAAFDPSAARDVLCVPPEAEPMLFTPLGYPADTADASPRHTQRRPLGELVRYERW